MTDHGPSRPPMNPALNTTVRAMLDAERVTASAHGRDNAPLFDPAWSPAMWERANKAVRDLRWGVSETAKQIALAEEFGLDPTKFLNEKCIQLDSHDSDMADFHDLPDDAVVVWYVDRKKASVGYPDHKTERETKRVDWFASTIQFAQEIDDYHRFGDEDDPRYVADYELRCNVNIAMDCTAPLGPDVNDYGGGSTRLMPVQRGQFILLFRCCRACEAQAGRDADTNFKISVLEAQAKLPPGARIDPGSSVPPQP